VGQQQSAQAPTAQAAADKQAHEPAFLVTTLAGLALAAEIFKFLGSFCFTWHGCNPPIHPINWT
jgi:hypothetical protein